MFALPRGLLLLRMLIYSRFKVVVVGRSKVVARTLRSRVVMQCCVSVD